VLAAQLSVLLEEYFGPLHQTLGPGSTLGELELLNYSQAEKGEGECGGVVLLPFDGPLMVEKRRKDGRGRDLCFLFDGPFKIYLI
jgi:hypothetical protein